MSEAAARELAERVRAGRAGEVEVRREGRFFVVVVHAGGVRHVLRDLADWEWLQSQPR